MSDSTSEPSSPVKINRMNDSVTDSEGDNYNNFVEERERAWNEGGEMLIFLYLFIAIVFC